jgi:hypothetical protein
MAKEEFNDRNFLTLAQAIPIVLPADLNALDKNGDTPLHVALRTGFSSLQYLTMYATLDQLLKGGANPAIKNKQGQTPLNLLDQMVAEIKECEQEPYLKYREHVEHRIHLGVLHTVRLTLFNPF